MKVKAAVASAVRVIANPSDKQVRFEFVAETPGALRYVEIDADGTPLVSDEDGAYIGNLYFRKRLFGEVSADWASEGTAPKHITITISAHDA